MGNKHNAFFYLWPTQRRHNRRKKKCNKTKSCLTKQSILLLLFSLWILINRTRFISQNCVTSSPFNLNWGDSMIEVKWVLSKARRSIFATSRQMWTRIIQMGHILNSIFCVLFIEDDIKLSKSEETRLDKKLSLYVYGMYRTGLL